LDRIEESKRNVVSLPEAELKAYILNEIFIKDTFYNCFKQAKEIKQADKDIVT
jgi:hypothetical protein